jgi:hypothetical protein
MSKSTPPEKPSKDKPDDRKGDDEPSAAKKIAPVAERIGEAADNLRRRKSWFQKRFSRSD